TTCRLNNMSTRLHLAVTFACLDHRRSDAIFYAVERLKKLALGKDGSLILGNQPVDPNHRSLADALGDVVVGLFSGHNSMRSNGRIANRSGIRGIRNSH